MYGLKKRQVANWWKFKTLDRTYQPLLEKAQAEGTRDTYLKVEEQYWYETACLLEERRKLRLIKSARNSSARSSARSRPHHSLPGKKRFVSPHHSSPPTQLSWPWWWTASLSLIGGALLGAASLWMFAPPTLGL